MPTTISAETLLLVEGNDHRNFFEAFSKHLGISQMNIEDFGGVSQLSEYLSALVKSRELPESAASESCAMLRTPLGRRSKAYVRHSAKPIVRSQNSTEPILCSRIRLGSSQTDVRR